VLLGSRGCALSAIVRCTEMLNIKQHKKIELHTDVDTYFARSDTSTPTNEFGDVPSIADTTILDWLFILGQLVVDITTIVIFRLDKFCWYWRFGSAVTKTSKPALSATDNNSPLSKVG